MTFPFPMIAPPAAVATLTQVASATSTGASVTGPAGIQVGDLLVLFDRAANPTATPPTSVVPSGFNPISDLPFSSAAGISARAVLSYKIATGAEANVSITGMDDAGDGKMLYVFRGDVVITSVVVSTPNAQGTDGNPSPQNVASSGGVVPLVVIGTYGSNNTIDPRTFSPAKDGEITSASNRYLAYKIYNSNPADVSVDMDDEGDSHTLQSCYLSCS